MRDRIQNMVGIGSVRYYMRRKPIEALADAYDPNTDVKPTDLYAETEMIAQRLCACPFCSQRWWADVETETVHHCPATRRTDRFMVPAL